MEGVRFAFDPMLNAAPSLAGRRRVSWYSVEHGIVHYYSRAGDRRD